MVRRGRVHTSHVLRSKAHASSPRVVANSGVGTFWSPPPATFLGLVECNCSPVSPVVRYMLSKLCLTERNKQSSARRIVQITPTLESLVASVRKRLGSSGSLQLG